MRVDPPAHKVASSEVTNTPLLHAMASTGKPMLLSTGMCDMIDVETAVEICEAAGNRELALLQCGTVYPLPTEQANIRVLRTFADRFGAPVGFSDHTLSNTAVCAAVSLGAAVIEKHFTFDSKAEGPDHFYALEPAALKDFVAVVRETHAALGDGVKEMLPSEREHGRRDGLYVSRDLPAGHILTAEDIAVRRPALGLRSRHYDMVIGARLKKPLAEAAPLHWDVLAYGRE
jgi:sialic acid synthase SpsE